MGAHGLQNERVECQNVAHLLELNLVLRVAHDAELVRLDQQLYVGLEQAQVAENHARKVGRREDFHLLRQKYLLNIVRVVRIYLQAVVLCLVVLLRKERNSFS